MTRFREQRRIDQAIKQGNIEELNWAAAYCRTRIEHADKMHIKHWQQQLKAIEAALSSMDELRGTNK